MTTETELTPGQTYTVGAELISGKTYEIFVKPNSKKEEIVVEAGKIIVRVQEPAEDGKANKAVVKLFREKHAISIEIVSGYTSRTKRVLLKKGGAALPQKNASKLSVHQLSLF